jgi:DNA-binding MarR family transcriptional regulator
MGTAMAGTTKPAEETRSRIILGLLESVERGGEQSQRRLASELGVALGLVNAYLKRCIRKGLIKVSEAPARRYQYYLTPHGFAEKTKLTVEYMSLSFSLFRRAKADCTAALEAAVKCGFTRVALIGISDLAEIANICAHDTGATIVAVVDFESDATSFAGIPVAKSLKSGTIDAVLVTDIRAPREAAERAIAELGSERVFIPALLGVRPILLPGDTA